ncbi:uncharacterized protein G2W53_001594 [Senna tora]|uniref:Uncharacterized protein n=1 Tax=Senna tora TaxID=362788 RepID=A0A834XG72_9FABA|nr:uncharacterized protein G2W53_001594 [Senna tora]
MAGLCEGEKSRVHRVLIEFSGKASAEGSDI